MTLRSYLSAWLAWGSALLVAAPSVAWAGSPSGEGHEGGLRFIGPISPMFSGDPDKRTGLLWIVVNFVIFLWVLDRLLFRPLRARTTEKFERVREQAEAAKIARERAESLMAEYEARMQRVDEEVETLLADARKRAEADRARILAEANAEADRIRQEAKHAAEREAERILRELRGEIVDKAVAQAEAVLRQAITPSDEARLRTRFVEQLEGTSIGGTPS
ncbi:MAG: hypothetical protein D6705_15165 [Deltaproteobacteria bacterium]|nr:MAG: hypothetical protein D6705_15165 [Deltaproteobacteria bacterium]